MTACFLEATEEMRSGELLSLPTFDLNDTMSAFEIMDPQMDSKVALKNSLIPRKALEEGVVTEALGHPHLAALLDQFLLQEASWLRGNSLAQTVFASQHLAQERFFQAHPLTPQFLGTFRVIPDIRLFQFADDLGQPFIPCIEVKDTP